MFIVQLKICCQRLAPDARHFTWYLNVPQKVVCEHPNPNAPYGSCNISSSIGRSVAHSNQANTVFYVWKLHCAGIKTQSLTKSKISLVCVNGFSSFFTNYKHDHRLETAIKFDLLVWSTFEKISDFSVHNVIGTRCTDMKTLAQLFITLDLQTVEYFQVSEYQVIIPISWGTICDKKFISFALTAKV